MDIARCIKRQPNTDTTGPHAGIHNYTSENIEFACCSGYTRSNNTPEPKRVHDNLQAGLLAGLDSGSNKFPGIHFDNLLRTILLPFGEPLKPNINNLLRKL